MSQAPDISGTEGERLDATVTVDSTFASQQTQTIELRIEDSNGTTVHSDTQDVTLADATDSQQITLSWPTSDGDKGVYDLFLESDQDTIQRLVEIVSIKDTPLTNTANHVWYMDEGSGTNVSDSVGAIDGTLANGNWGTGAGVGNVYVSPSGAQDTADFGEVLGGLDTWTVTCWVKPPDSNQFNDVIDEGSTDGFQIGDAGNSSVIRFQTDAGTDQDYSLTSSEIDEWVFCAMVADSGSFTGYLYVPGQGQVFKQGTSGVRTSIPTGRNFDMGDATVPFDYGIVVESAVSESTLTDHFEATKGLYQ